MLAHDPRHEVHCKSPPPRAPPRRPPLLPADRLVALTPAQSASAEMATECPPYSALCRLSRTTVHDAATDSIRRRARVRSSAMKPTVTPPPTCAKCGAELPQ